MSAARLLSFHGWSDHLCKIEHTHAGEPDEFSPDLETGTATVEVSVPSTDEGLCVNWLFNGDEMWSLGISQLREGVPLPAWQWTFGTLKHPDGSYGNSVTLHLEAASLAQIRLLSPEPETS